MHATTLNILMFFGLFIYGWISLVMIEASAKTDKKRKKEREKSARLKRIRDLEMEIYGRCLDQDDNKDLVIPIEKEDENVQ